MIVAMQPMELYMYSFSLVLYRPDAICGWGRGDMQTVHRALDKREYLIIIFLITHQNHML